MTTGIVKSIKTSYSKCEMKVVLTTSEPKDAPILIQRMLEERLVGCGNIINGVQSMYWWKGAIQNESESLIIMETTEEICSKAINRLAEIHPYDVPKIVALETSSALEAYKNWLQEETRK
jgi:periplasmic divalent cation tolerance protein